MVCAGDFCGQSYGAVKTQSATASVAADAGHGGCGRRVCCAGSPGDRCRLACLTSWRTELTHIRRSLILAGHCG